MGDKIDDGFFKRNPHLATDLKAPVVSDEAKEIYSFIVDNPYTINRGGGMGMDVAIIPDMTKLCEIGEKEGVDIYTYKEFCYDFIVQQNKQEARSQKEQERLAKNKK